MSGEASTDGAGRRPRATVVVLTLVGLGLVVATAACGRSTAPRSASPAGVPLREGGAGRECLTGELTTAFGGTGQVYFLTEQDGRRHEVVFEPGAVDAVGGPLAVDRRLLTVRGEPAGTSPAGIERVRALMVALGEESCA